jgi:hypothetical protein
MKALNVALSTRPPRGQLYSLVQNPTHQNTMVHKTEQNEKTQISTARVKTAPGLLW